MAKKETGPPVLIKTKDNKFFRHIDVAGFNGYVPAEDPRPEYPEMEPYMNWFGGKIALSLWSQVMAFFEWSQKEFKSEVQVRLYYNTENKKWGVWAYPQKPDGMTTREVEDHPDVARQRSQFPPPWILLGTIHHHCTSSAWQSSTDRSNEETQEGVHITVGKIGSTEYDLHIRMIVRGFQFDKVPLSMWFDMPPGTPDDYPFQLKSTILEFFLKRPPKEDVAFPEQWKTNCIKREPIKLGTGSGSGSFHTSHGAATSSFGVGRNTIPVKTDLRSQFKPEELDFMKEAIALMDLREVSQNQVDSILFEELPAKRSDLEDSIAKEFMAIGAKHKIADARLNQLFDIFDFDAVINELFPETNKIVPA